MGVGSAAAPGVCQGTAGQRLSSSPVVPGAVWAEAGLGRGAASLLPACLLIDPLGFPTANSEKSSQAQGFQFSQALVPHRHFLELTQKNKQTNKKSSTVLAAALGLSSTATTPSLQRKSCLQGNGCCFPSRLMLGGFFSQPDFWQDVEA